MFALFWYFAIFRFYCVPYHHHLCVECYCTLPRDDSFAFISSSLTNFITNSLYIPTLFSTLWCWRKSVSYHSPSIIFIEFYFLDKDTNLLSIITTYKIVLSIAIFLKGCNLLVPIWQTDLKNPILKCSIQVSK